MDYVPEYRWCVYFWSASVTVTVCVVLVFVSQRVRAVVFEGGFVAH